jgi:signal transduction histidine kinase
VEPGIEELTAAGVLPSAGLAWPGAVVDRLASAVRPLARMRAALWPALIAVLTVSSVVFSRANPGVLSLGVAVGLGVVATAPLAVCVRWPEVALGAVVCVNCVYVVVARFEWPASAVVAWFLALAAAPLLLSRKRAAQVLVVSEIGVLVAVMVSSSVNDRPWDASVAEGLAAVLAWGVGESVRVRRVLLAGEAQAARRLGELQERESVARGRVAIARDLHDVVAHHVSLIAVLAATSPYQLADLSPETEHVFDEIAREARVTLDELRRVLGVLRTSNDAAVHVPQPVLDDLPELVSRAEASGVEIQFEIAGEVRPVLGAVQLCGYRVVQEALTNARRHAPGSVVVVQLSYTDDDVGVTITNTGTPAVTATVSSASSGFGLIGMRERVETLDGVLDAGPTADGFRVRARIPCPRQSRAR